jgi:hypothetical protein
MNCPECGAEATLTSPDYGFGYGAEFRCTAGARNHGSNDYRFVDKTPAGRAESDAARARSAAEASRRYGDAT